MLIIWICPHYIYSLSFFLFIGYLALSNGMQFEQWIIYSAILWKTLSWIPLPANENQFLGAQRGNDKERTIFVDITWWFQIIVHNFVAPRGLHNLMKLWSMSFRATPDEWVIVESYEKMWKISPPVQKMGANLIQMTIVSTTVGKNPLKGVE